MKVNFLSNNYITKKQEINKYTQISFGKTSADIFVHSSNNELNNCSSSSQKDFVDFILGNNKEIENIFLTYNFEQYKKDGIPLKYSRDELIGDISSILRTLSESEQDILLSKFNLRKGIDDIDGIPILKDTEPKTKEEKAINYLIKKYYYENESTIEEKTTKKAFDSLINGLPEFNMTIGKKQHKTHIYSVDIHSLVVLQKCMKHPLYKTLSDEDKQVIKLSALMHDFGKKGNVTTNGHSIISGEYVTPILKKSNFSEDVKERTFNHINNHHWFQLYNQGYSSKEDVLRTFKTDGDAKIAQILTKSDFESVKPDFHLRYLIPFTNLTQKEFDSEFNKMMDALFN